MCASKRFKSHLNINLISVRHEYGKDECKGYGKLKRSLWLDAAQLRQFCSLQNCTPLARPNEISKSPMWTQMQSTSFTSSKLPMSYVMRRWIVSMCFKRDAYKYTNSKNIFKFVQNSVKTFIEHVSSLCVLDPFLRTFPEHTWRICVSLAERPTPQEHQESTAEKQRGKTSSKRNPGHQPPPKKIKRPQTKFTTNRHHKNTDRAQRWPNRQVQQRTISTWKVPPATTLQQRT